MNNETANRFLASSLLERMFFNAPNSLLNVFVVLLFKIRIESSMSFTMNLSESMYFDTLESLEM